MKKLLLVVRMWPEHLLPIFVVALALCAIVVCLVISARRTRLQLAHQHPWGTMPLLLLLWITHALCLAMGIVCTVYIFHSEVGKEAPIKRVFGITNSPAAPVGVAVQAITNDISKDVLAAVERALLADDRGVMAALLNDGLSPDAVISFDGVARPLLHSAALADSAHVGKLLLHRGADKEKRDHLGYQPIEYSLMRPNSQIVHMLSKPANTFTSLTEMIGHVVASIVAKDRPQAPQHTVAITVDYGEVSEGNSADDARGDVVPPDTNPSVGYTVKIWQHQSDSDTWNYSITQLSSGHPVQRRDGTVQLIEGYWIATDINSVDY